VSSTTPTANMLLNASHRLTAVGDAPRDDIESGNNSSSLDLRSATSATDTAATDVTADDGRKA
jgi:hypothetical protein